MTHVQKFKNEVAETLSELGNIPDLNLGGCAIAALAIKKHIIKHYTSKASGYNYKWKVDVVYLGDGYDQNREAVKGNNDPTSCSHAIILNAL